MANVSIPSMPGSPLISRGWTRPIVLWLLISLLFICSHFSFHFLRPHYEGSDFAANALQIRQAKVFRELYGNYSRFGFHHPGPAFFYVYALGEVVLFDTLKVVPAPYNAHVITGIFVQALFFTWALVIVARRVRRTLLLPLMLVFAAVHFGILNHNIPDSAFESIWPPYALLFPFLCFIVACASLASGEVKDLLPCVLAGGLLVHGHVAQPLFVLPLFTTAFIAFWFTRYRKTDENTLPRRPGGVYYISAACTLAVFLLPLILDASRGEQSNLRLIFRHFLEQTSDHKSLAQAVTYLGTFFYYVGNPENYCNPLSLSNLTFLVDRAQFLWLWILIAIVILVAPKPILKSERRFFFWLLFLFAIAVLLTLVWATRQNGEMFAFNAYFNFALLYVPFILLAISLLSWSEVRPARSVRLLLYAVAIALGIGAAKSWTRSSNLHGAPSGTKEMVERIRQAAAEDQQGSTTKFLSFEHGVWQWAVGVALALDRFGYGYAVPADWAFVFGAHHTADLPLSLRRGQVALWTIKSPADGENWISTSVPSVNPAQTEITFSGTAANASAFVIRGWDVSTGPFSWSTEKAAVLYFSALPASSDVEIIFHVLPYTYPARKSQRLIVSFNEEPAQSFEVFEKSSFSIRVPMEVWNRRPSATLAFEFPDAISPLAAGESADSRVLGCGFDRVEFRSPPAANVSALQRNLMLQLSRSLSMEDGRFSRKDTRQWK